MPSVDQVLVKQLVKKLSAEDNSDYSQVSLAHLMGAGVHGENFARA